jgi:hypothetical protein
MWYLPVSFLSGRFQEILDLEKGMRAIEDVDRVIHGEAGVRIYSKTGHGNATISAWPSPKVSICTSAVKKTFLKRFKAGT